MKIIIDTEKDLIMSYIVEIEKVKSKEIENTYHYERLYALQTHYLIGNSVSQGVV